MWKIHFATMPPIYGELGHYSKCGPNVPPRAAVYNHMTRAAHYSLRWQGIPSPDRDECCLPRDTHGLPVPRTRDIVRPSTVSQSPRDRRIGSDSRHHSRDRTSTVRIMSSIAHRSSFQPYTLPSRLGSKRYHGKYITISPGAESILGGQKEVHAKVLKHESGKWHAALYNICHPLALLPSCLLRLGSPRMSQLTKNILIDIMCIPGHERDCG